MTDEMIVYGDWYQSLVDDCGAIITEAVHLSRWELIVGYHALGQRVSTDENYQRYSRGNGRILSRLSKDVNVSERNLYRAVQFFTKYPDPDKWPFDKNTSWNKIANECLPAPEAQSHPGKTIEMCFSNIEREVLYIQEHYPDWIEATIQRFMSLVRGEWK